MSLLERELLLLRRVQDRGSPLALTTMTDADLAEWLQLCQRMSQRASLASIARRSWKHLLAEALDERAARGLSRHSDAHQASQDAVHAEPIQVYSHPRTTQDIDILANPTPRRPTIGIASATALQIASLDSYLWVFDNLSVRCSFRWQ